MTNTANRRVEIYDTTLRDGAQGLGVTFSLTDKINITQHLDSLGVDFIEGGYPLSNPKDEAYFQQACELDLKHARVCAFGMTRRRGTVAREDVGMMALLASQSPVITIVGKTWDLHVDEVLRVSREENLEMIRDSVDCCVHHDDGVSREVFYDAEHFFDGYKANPDYALATLRAALGGGSEGSGGGGASGAARLILCDTNGGSLPEWISQVMIELTEKMPDCVEKLGIHAHNDSGLAVANSLAAVRCGAVQVQGTINGIGERCGNVDLTTVAANLKFKMGYDCLAGESARRLTETSRYVYGIANMNPMVNQPFVGSSAFAHKGGMHVHAVQRIAHSYEHINPEDVGNARKVLVSELSGASNIAATLGDKFDINDNRALQRELLEKVQDMENQGYEFESAMASFELLLHDALGRDRNFWALDHYRCSITKRDDHTPITEAVVRMRIGELDEYRVAEGDGPVNALDGALRKCLQGHYPQLASLHLRDYKVRVVNATAESAAKVRVVIQFAADSQFFGTIGVSENIVDASWQALVDAMTYYLIECGMKP